MKKVILVTVSTTHLELGRLWRTHSRIKVLRSEGSASVVIKKEGFYKDERRNNIEVHWFRRFSG